MIHDQKFISHSCIEKKKVTFKGAKELQILLAGRANLFFAFSFESPKYHSNANILLALLLYFHILSASS